MEKKSDNPEKGKIILFGKEVVENAVEKWNRGNEIGDERLIEESSRQLKLYEEIFPIAQYFSAIAHIQLWNDTLVPRLQELFEALEILLNNSEVKNSTLLRSCREVMYFLAEQDRLYPLSDHRPENVTIHTVKNTLAIINKKGLSQELFTTLYEQISALLGR
ncbi:hypothetical protein GF369_01590 [Candidatus Peregrinibacteria bacterium]|nr:hypothetical protein [Candidatus Peregrinibacteria bacterium]